MAITVTTYWSLTGRTFTGRGYPVGCLPESCCLALPGLVIRTKALIWISPYDTTQPLITYTPLHQRVHVAPKPFVPRMCSSYLMLGCACSWCAQIRGRKGLQIPQLAREVALLRATTLPKNLPGIVHTARNASCAHPCCTKRASTATRVRTRKVRVLLVMAAWTITPPDCWRCLLAVVFHAWQRCMLGCDACMWLT
jgi:hypothetical protein